eukprot:1748236-Pyramimonas_sp.AAC.1
MEASLRLLWPSRGTSWTFLVRIEYRAFLDGGDDDEDNDADDRTSTTTTTTKEMKRKCRAICLKLVACWEPLGTT